MRPPFKRTSESKGKAIPLKVTVNFFDGEKEYPRNIVIDAVAGKDPIIFIIPADYKKQNVFDFVHHAETLRNAILVMDDFDTTRLVSYLVSFNDLETRNIFYAVPKGHEKNIDYMLASTNQCIRQILGLEQKKETMSSRKQFIKKSGTDDNKRRIIV